ncbi:hypothetical protein EV424DRAFT_1531717 [Suillus variegatus]|nr:hypothetical protein EV424DRAFT_1531717 [Suillus variegatus]
MFATTSEGNLPSWDELAMDIPSGVFHSITEVCLVPRAFNLLNTPQRIHPTELSFLVTVVRPDWWRTTKLRPKLTKGTFERMAHMPSTNSWDILFTLFREQPVEHQATLESERRNWGMKSAPSSLPEGVSGDMGVDEYGEDEDEDDDDDMKEV